MHPQRFLLWFFAPAIILVLLTSGCAATPSATAQPSKQPPDAPRLDILVIEDLVSQRVNAIRAQRKIPLLAEEASLVRLSRSHSQDMAQNRFFGHTNSKGLSPQERAKKARVSCLTGENLFYGYLHSSFETWMENGVISTRYFWKTEQDISEEAVTGWLNSPPHREALLDSKYRRQGIGASISADGKVYITQTLCK